MENKHTRLDLLQMQSLPLKYKIIMTCQRIKAWYDYWDGQVYVSFSGGKDSTVLVDLVHRVCGLKDVPLVFVDTGLEYPEIRDFVKTFDNVEWIKPSMQFKEVIKNYGYPFISKEVANNVDGAMRYVKALTDRQTDSFRMPTCIEDYKELANTLNKDWGNVKGSPRRVAIMLGMLTKEGKANIPNKDRSAFSMTKYSFLLESPYPISDKCCNIMKKKPTSDYTKKTGRKPITAQMAEESRLRTQKWIQNGCNAFDSKKPISNPMSFWTEQDVLRYIKEFDISIASVYGDVVYTDDDGMEYTEQTFACDMPLKTTGCRRTGCMFCGFGCHLEKESRFERMKSTHPKQYEWIMKDWSEGGLEYKKVIDWLNEHGDLGIKY